VTGEQVVPPFTLLVTANAFRARAGAGAPLVAAGGELLIPPKMGPLPAEELIPWLRRADVVIASTDPYGEPVLSACPRLRAVLRWGTGYDSVDLAACTRHGVVACNAPQLNVAAVADHVVMVMLALARRLTRQAAVMRSGGWEEVRGVELAGKSVGLVGFGAIGRAVARRLQGFGCRVLASDPLIDEDALRQAGVEPRDLPELFAGADFVSLHAALTPENRGLVAEPLLRRMKRSAFFVNAARGPLVDEAALVRALSEGWIAGASVDVFSEEPLPPDHPLRHLPNCLATPHTAFNTEEAAAATNRLVVEQALAVLKGARPAHILNPEVCDRPEFGARPPLLRA